MHASPMAEVDQRSALISATFVFLSVASGLGFLRRGSAFDASQPWRSSPRACSHPKAPCSVRSRSHSVRSAAPLVVQNPLVGVQQCHGRRAVACRVRVVGLRSPRIRHLRGPWKRTAPPCAVTSIAAHGTFREGCCTTVVPSPLFEDSSSRLFSPTRVRLRRSKGCGFRRSEARPITASRLSSSLPSTRPPPVLHLA